MKTEELVKTGQSPVSVTIGFQSLVAEASHNQALLLARAPVSLLMQSGYASIAPLIPQSGARLLKAHRQVFEALKAHDEKEAVNWTRKHLEDYRRGFEWTGLNFDDPIAASTP